MKRKVHMRDQVHNKVESIMNHYHYGECSTEMWASKFVLVGAILAMGVYWHWQY